MVCFELGSSWRSVGVWGIKSAVSYVPLPSLDVPVGAFRLFIPTLPQAPSRGIVGAELLTFDLL